MSKIGELRDRLLDLLLEHERDDALLPEPVDHVHEREVEEHAVIRRVLEERP